VVVRTKKVPGFTNVFFSLLKGHLLSNSIGLISHCVMWMLMGI